MAQEFAKKFYSSRAWRQCRAGYIAIRKAIDGGLCETCREQPGYIVHHKIRLTPQNINHPEISLNYEHLKYDCLVCHNREGMKEEKPRFRFGPDGQVYPP